MPRCARQLASQVPPPSREILGADGPFAARWAQFEPRDGQLDLAEAIELAIATGEHLLAEAATGIGKTYAYLVPAILAGRKTIVSTGTRNLQDQLFHRDLPRVLAALELEFNVALLKGRSNYLCHYRLDQARGRSTLGKADQQVLVELERWSTVATSGDLADFDGLPESGRLRSMITSTSENCLGQNCPFYDQCFVAAARQRAQKADLVVVNHHLLFADMSLRREGFAELLPQAEVVIVDEAHKVPDTASLFFGRRLSTRQLEELSQDTLREAAEQTGALDQLRPITDALKQALRAFRLALHSHPARGDWRDLRRQHDVLNATTALLDCLRDLAGQLEHVAVRSAGLEHCWRRALELVASLDEMVGGELADVIAWYEHSKHGVQINLTPLSVAAELDAFRLQTAASWIFTSATLAVGKRFDLFAEAVGLCEPAVLQIRSPFDYERQALLYLPSLPEPSSANYTIELLEAVLPLAETLGGRTLLLFTSHRALRVAATWLLDRTDLVVWVQGERPRHALLEAFVAQPGSILLGAASFWEGVDVPGEALRCVVIDKLPFAPPDDPVTRGRREALASAGRNPFIEWQLPQAILNLKQGVGRLIRDINDVGLLVIGDPRLQSKPYGRQFRANLPSIPITQDADIADKFCHSLSAD